MSRKGRAGDDGVVSPVDVEFAPGGTLAVWLRISRRLAAVRVAGIAAGVILLSGLFAVLNSNFLRIANLLNVSRQISLLGLMAIGLTFVLVSGQIDLSVGSIFGVSSVLGGWLIFHHAGVPLAIVVALCVGAGAGLVNGVLSAQFGLPSFIVTLGMLEVLRGIALLITNGTPLGLFGIEARGLSTFYYTGQGRVFGIPMQFIILMGVGVLAALLLHRTRYGLDAYASGGSAQAARLAGVPVVRVRIVAFVISGVLAALAGLLGLAFIGSVEPTAGQGTEFNVFAAAVLGGVSLFGGEGNIWGAVLGAALLGILGNGLVLLNVNAFWQTVVIGLVTIAAIGINKIVSSRRTSYRGAS